MTEASIILLLCIPVERAWASVTGHFSLGSLVLLAISFCLRMMLNLFKNKVYTWNSASEANAIFYGLFLIF